MTRDLPESEMAVRLLGLRPEAKCTAILETIAAAGSPLTVKEIVGRGGVRNETAGQRASLYRCLSLLKNLGVIEVYDEGYIHRYGTTPERIRSVVRNLLRSKIEELEGERLLLVDRLRAIEGLSDSDIREIAEYIRNSFLGVDSSLPTLFSNRTSKMVEVLHEQIVRRLRAGDVLRMSIAWDDVFFSEENTTMNMLGRLLDRGVEVRVLAPPIDEIPVSRLNVVRSYYEEMLAENRHIEIRHRIGSKKTYQIVAKNRDVILLVISTYPFMAQVIPYNGNPELVNDSIDAFDEHFQRGLPLCEL
ncbi:MAG: hypothetical protein ACTSPE_12480 [Candidatus Thorarchaeota archaeon]